MKEYWKIQSLSDNSSIEIEKKKIMSLAIIALPFCSFIFAKFENLKDEIMP